MCKLISRIRVRNSGNNSNRSLPQSALVNHERLQLWRARYLEATGKQATTNELLQELDQAVEEYNQSAKARVVA